jgi:hypothetical protein
MVGREPNRVPKTVCKWRCEVRGGGEVTHMSAVTRRLICYAWLLTHRVLPDTAFRLHITRLLVKPTKVRHVTAWWWYVCHQFRCSKTERVIYITNSVEHSASWEAGSRQVHHEISHVIWNPDFISVYTRLQHWTVSSATAVQSLARSACMNSDLSAWFVSKITQLTWMTVGYRLSTKHIKQNVN